MPSPTELRVPNPVSSSPARLLAVLGGGAAAVCVLLLLILAREGLTAGYVAAAIGLPFGAAAILAVAYRIVRPGRCRLRLEDGLIQGVPGGPLIAGKGRLVVDWTHTLIPSDVRPRTVTTTTDLSSEPFLLDTDIDPTQLYESYVTLEFISDADDHFIVERGRDPRRVRAFAEGLCRLGGYTLTWCSPSGDDVRAPADLDVPVLVRLARTPGAVPKPKGPLDPLGSALALPEFPVRFGSWLVALGVGGAVAFVSAMVVAGEDPAYASAGWMTVGLLFGVMIVLFVYTVSLRPSVIVAPGEVRLTTAILGIPLPTRRIASARLTSLYVEPNDAAPYHFHLVFAGDGFYYRSGFFERLDDAKDLLHQTIATLAGAG